MRALFFAHWRSRCRATCLGVFALVGGLIWFSSSALAADASSVVALAWPTRSVDAIAHGAHVTRVGRLLASRMSAAFSEGAKSRALDLSGHIGRARSQFAAGDLDAAAKTLDAALEEGAKTPYGLVDPAGFITGHLMRISIARARGENERARVLADRVLGYDPEVTPSAAEQSPPLGQELKAARARFAGRPSLRPEDWQNACHDGGKFILTGRALGVDAIEWTRVENCRITTQVITPAGGNDEEVVAALLGEKKTHVVSPRKRALWPKVLIAATGAALIVTGGVLAGLAGGEFDQLKTSPCGLAANCNQSTAETWRTRETAGYALIGVGAAAVVAGVVWAVFEGSRRSTRAEWLHRGFAYGVDF